MTLRLIVIVLALLFVSCATNSPGGDRVTQSECRAGCTSGAMLRSGCIIKWPETGPDQARGMAAVDAAVAACEFGCLFADPDPE